MRKSLETAYTHQVFDYEDHAFDVAVVYFCRCVLSGNALRRRGPRLAESQREPERDSSRLTTTTAVDRIHRESARTTAYVVLSPTCLTHHEAAFERGISSRTAHLTGTEATETKQAEPSRPRDDGLVLRQVAQLRRSGGIVSINDPAASFD